MSKSLALLSGKGGSGKTTMALSIASMLASCGIKVLLIDCDLSTNGATYFYENRLSDNNGEIISFYKILSEDVARKYQVLNINPYMDFIPSVIQITKENAESYVYKKDDIYKILDFSNTFFENYDVVLYDCQAGYTDILKLLLPLVDINLVVMEADTISSSAIRSFHLKAGDILNRKKVYQIFNKTSKEEYDIYSKLSGGTVFTNIETVKFDWKIRKAFSVAQIPDMESTSADYGEQVYNICGVLFKDENIQEKLGKYKVVIQLNQNKEEEKKLEDKIDELHKDSNNTKNKLIKTIYSFMMPVFAAAIISIFLQFTDREIFRYSSETSLFIIFVVLIMILTMVISLWLMTDLTKEKRNRYKELDLYREKLKEIMENSQKLQKQYDSLNEKLKDI